jgi:DNA-binding response OmpR family regulator
MYASRILYVDDDRDSCEMLDALLHCDDEDYEVVTVESAEGAINLMRDLSFDLVILDWRMREVSGLDLCRLIRKSDEGVPIIFYSAMARPEDRTAARSTGANAYLVKPNDLDVVCDTVRWLLKESSQSPQGSPKFVKLPALAGNTL